MGHARSCGLCSRLYHKAVVVVQSGSICNVIDAEMDGI